MDSQHPFDVGLKDWLESVNAAVKKELEEKPTEYRELFYKINSALTLFSPIAEKLPVDNAGWIYGEDEILRSSSSIQIIMEFLTQAIYMETIHLWPAANHSARCGLEHTLWTIWQIIYPKEIKTKIGGADQAKFSEIKKSIFDIPRFDKYKDKFVFLGDGSQTKNLMNKITEIYGHLSYYVHTSNIHIELKGARPHITHDLSKNPRAERDTWMNISDTFEIIVIILTIACKEYFREENIKELEKITSPESYKIIFEDRRR